ncbi:MAG: hypothetical protein ACO36E_10930 [Synechocystis sp.]
METLPPPVLPPKTVTRQTAWLVYLFKLSQVWPLLFLTWHFYPYWQSVWQHRRLMTLIVANGLLLIGVGWGGLTCGFNGCGEMLSPGGQTENFPRVLAQASSAEQALLQQSQQAATQAAQLAQNADGSPSNWLQRQELLQQAIAPLLQIPDSSVLYDFAQAQKRIYQQQLTTIALHLDQEQTAQNRLTQAIAVIERAKAASLGAQTPTALNQALAQWQEGLQQLAQIPASTSASSGAQQRLTVSRAEWETVKVKQMPLVQGNVDYQAALNFAQAAATAMENAEWETSVKSWQQAIAALEKIPPHSDHAPQAQSLAPHYRQALQQGQQYLDRLAQQNQVRANLETLCQSKDKPCQFTITEQEVAVKLRQGYIQEVWDAALTAQVAGDPGQRAQLLNHLARLEETFQRLSNQGGLPLKVFHAQGQLLTTYQPQP